MKSLSNTSIRYIKGVGPAKAKLFANLGIESVEDLLYFFPRRYEDRRNLTPIAKTTVGETQTISGTVVGQEGRRSWFTKKHVAEVVLDDTSGRMTCVWFNQPYVEKYLQPGQAVVCHGKVDVYKNRLQMVAPEYEAIDKEEEENLSIKRIVPIYPLTKGISQRYLRKVVHATLTKHQDQLEDELPVPLRNKHRLTNIKRSIANIHFPDDFEAQEEAMRRISYEEFFFFQVSVILRRMSITHKPGIDHTIGEHHQNLFVQSFPFTLTGAQLRVIDELKEDMQKKTPMLRLLQGDVGSGKTVVALFGCYLSFLNRKQSCLMAPTEILAQQHFDNIKELIAGGPMEKMKIAFLSSRLKPAERKEVYDQIQSGDVDMVIGTHALINEEVQFKDLSFCTIDEQHKFGVRQRALLAEKGSNPDILIMTATPIPRTLCITLYGDLDVSILDELPPGRGKVKTLRYSTDQSEEIYQFIKEKVNEGRQAYVVYPIIEESEKLDMKAAKAMYKHFQQKEFENLKIALVHGQMKSDEAQTIMKDFKDKKIQVLIATTVIEVGVDVPNASVMVIEHAERFGLAQLHQLRGRIGRGEQDAFCVLIAETATEESQLRLKAMLSTTDGFKIAQKDLEIRGPGRYFGRHQHGLNELKVANPATQMDILELSRKDAQELLKEDPDLSKNKNPRIKEIIKQRYPTYLKMVKAG